MPYFVQSVWLKPDLPGAEEGVQNGQRELTQYLRVSDAIVDERTRGFVGREFVFREIDSLPADTGITFVGCKRFGLKMARLLKWPMPINAW